MPLGGLRNHGGLGDGGEGWHEFITYMFSAYYCDWLLEGIGATVAASSRDFMIFMDHPCPSVSHPCIVS